MSAFRKITFAPSAPLPVKQPSGFGSSSFNIASNPNPSSDPLSFSTNHATPHPPVAKPTKLQPVALGSGPVLPSLNLNRKMGSIDTSIFDRDDYFGKRKDSQWGIPTVRPPESLAPRVTPRERLPSVQQPGKIPNTSLLDAERPQLARVQGSQRGSVADINLLLSNPVKPAFQGLSKLTAFDSKLTTPRQFA